MKAIITAGGRGTRLRPLTHTKNKHLLPVANKPMIYYAIEDVAEAGIKEVLININAGDTEVPNSVGDGKKWGIQITYQEQLEPKGLGHLLQSAEKFIGNDKFVFYYGDNIFTGNLPHYIKQWEKEGTNFHLCLAQVADPERFGVAVVDNNRVVRTVEKPKDYISSLAITGIQFYDHTIFEALKHIKPTTPVDGRTIAEMDIPPANQWLIDNNYTASYSIIDGWWKDTGKPETILEANRLVLEKLVKKVEGTITESKIEGNVEVPKTSSIKNSVIRGPVVIGENVHIENAYIGPFTSIFDDCKIFQSEIENSIILGGVQITNIKARMDENIIGWNAVIKGVNKLPNVMSMKVGDNSIVEIHN